MGREAAAWGEPGGITRPGEASPDRVTPDVTDAMPPRFDVGTDIRHTGVVKTVTTDSSGAPAGRDVADGRTRDRVARLLLELGPSTAATLGDRLGLSQTAIRRHLDAMVEGGILTSRDQRSYGPRGRGRPARVFALTDAGHAAGPSSYDDLAASALRFLAASAGEGAVADFAAARASEMEHRLRDVVGDLPLDQRPEALAEALSADGYSAGVSRVPTGAQLCQHHCPVQHVAEQFPQLCEAETAMLSSLLGTHVQRLATIAHGDGVCTTHIPVHTGETSTTPSHDSTVPISGRTSS
jgi:predicted ArsR family transcriptional regulator